MGATLVVLALGMVAAGIFLGFLIGKVKTQSEAEQGLQDAFQRGKDEAEVEKANLGVALNEELLKLRDGIQTLAQSYESTVRLVQERLGDSIRSSNVQIDGPAEMQLNLDFTPTLLDKPLTERFALEQPQEDLLQAALLEEPAEAAKSTPLSAEILVQHTPGVDRLDVGTFEAESVEDDVAGTHKLKEERANDDSRRDRDKPFLQ